MPISASLAVDASSGTSNRATGWVPLNLHETPFNVSFGIEVTGVGQPTVQVQHTFDDVLRGETAGVFVHEDVTAGVVTSAANTLDGNYAFPVRAIRANVVSCSGNATVTFKVLQAGI